MLAPRVIMMVRIYECFEKVLANLLGKLANAVVYLPLI